MASIIAPLVSKFTQAKSVYDLFVRNEQHKVGDLVIDCVLNEEISFSNTITEHPIEEGSNITDHVFNNQTTVTMTGIITDTPLLIYGIIETPLQNNSLSSIVKNVKNLLPFSKDEKLSIRAYNILRDYIVNRELVTIVSSYEVFDNILLRNFKTTRNNSSGNALHFSVDLVQINIVSDTDIGNNTYNSLLTSELIASKKSLGLINKVKTTVSDKIKGLLA